MSISLPSINLSTAIVGTTGSIPLTPAAFYQPGAMSARAKAHVWIINSSGCGLKFTKHSTGETFAVADRHYPVIEVVPDESSLDFVVVYVTAGPPSNILQAVFYPPEEDISAVAGAGLPAQGGTAPSTIANSLSNELQSQGTGVIDIGFGANTNIFTLNNEAQCSWIVWDTTNNRQIGVLTVPGNVPLTNPIGVEFVTRIQADNGIFTGGNGVPVNGTTSGSALLFQPFAGPFAVLYAKSLALNMTAAGNADLIFPTPLTGNIWFYASSPGYFQFNNGASGVGIQQWISATAGSNDSVSPQTLIKNNWFGHADNVTIDRIRYIGASVGSPSNGGGANGFILVVGN